MVHLVAYALLLVTTMSWLQAIAFVAIHQGLLGLYLGCSFAPNHKGMPPSVRGRGARTRCCARC